MKLDTELKQPIIANIVVGLAVVIEIILLT